MFPFLLCLYFLIRRINCLLVLKSLVNIAKFRKYYNSLLKFRMATIDYELYRIDKKNTRIQINQHFKSSFSVNFLAPKSIEPKLKLKEDAQKTFILKIHHWLKFLNWWTPPSLTVTFCVKLVDPSLPLINTYFLNDPEHFFPIIIFQMILKSKMY